MAASPKGGEGKKSRRRREAARGKKPEKEVFFLGGGRQGSQTQRDAVCSASRRIQASDVERNGENGCFMAIIRHKKRCAMAAAVNGHGYLFTSAYGGRGGRFRAAH